MSKKRKTNSEEDDESENISSKGNVVYFHSHVSRTTVHCLIHELNAACDYLKEIRTSVSADLRIKLYIHSEGGDLYSGLSAMEHIKNCEFDVDTYVDGYVASAGTFLLLGGKRRFMNKYSELLIHQFSVGVYGQWKYTELSEQHMNNEKLMKMMKAIYKEKTKIPAKVLNTILSKEVSFSSNECLEYHIVDELT